MRVKGWWYPEGSEGDARDLPDAAVVPGTLGSNVKRFRGGLVFKAHRLLYHSTLGSRVIKKKKVPGRR